MSRSPSVTPPKPQFSAEDEARRAAYSDVPTIRGFDGVVDYVAETFNIQITVHYVRSLVDRRRLARYVICGRVHFSPRDVFTAVILNNRRLAGVFRRTRRNGPTPAA